jgi:hypothetical protein
VPGYADLLIYFAVVGAALVAYLVGKHRREASKPRRGVADAYDGNVAILPPAHGQRGTSFRASLRSGRGAHGGGHNGHLAGHHPGGGHL